MLNGCSERQSHKRSFSENDWPDDYNSIVHAAKRVQVLHTAYCNVQPGSPRPGCLPHPSVRYEKSTVLRKNQEVKHL